MSEPSKDYRTFNVTYGDKHYFVSKWGDDFSFVRESRDRGSGAKGGQGLWVAGKPLSDDMAEMLAALAAHLDQARPEPATRPDLG